MAKDDEKQQGLNDLTEEERLALADDEAGPNPDDEIAVATDDDLEAEETPEQKAARETAEEAAAAAAAGNETEEQKAARLAAEAAASEKDKESAPAPLLVSQAPADAEAQIAAIKSQKKDLFKQFDDGELSTAQYGEKLEELNDQQRQIELAVHDANLAARMAAQQARNSFLAEVKAFTEEANPLYSKSATAWQQLDAEVRRIASDKEASANLSGRQILAKAHENLMKDPLLKAAFDADAATRGAQPGKQEQPGKKTDIPPTLGRVPAANANDTGGDKFANLDRLFERDPLAYEEAVGKLSQAERDEYLSR